MQFGHQATAVGIGALKLRMERSSPPPLSVYLSINNRNQLAVHELNLTNIDFRIDSVRMGHSTVSKTRRFEPHKETKHFYWHTIQLSSLCVAINDKNINHDSYYNKLCKSSAIGGFIAIRNRPIAKRSFR